MEATNKIRVKLADAEFEAEGPVELINEQYEKFLAAVAAASHPVTRAVSYPGTAAREPIPPLPPSTNTIGATPVTTIPQNWQVPQQILERVFAVDQRGIVSLTVLPKTGEREADALIAILYGFRALRGEHMVGGTQLIDAARQSGFLIDRVDRTLIPRASLITHGGQRRGKRYGLNNPGMEHAETLLNQMFD